MGRSLSDVLKFAVAAAVGAFLIFGWLALSRGPALASDKTVIRIWDWWNPAGNPSLGAFFDKVERDFEAAHPDIDVRYQFIPFGTQYIQKLMSSFAAGNPPDAFQCSIIWATDLYDRGVIRDMNDLLADSPEVAPEAFFPISMSYISRDGRVFGIPTSMDANTLLYNREMFEQAGLDASPFSMKTWDDFVANAKRLTIRDESGRVERAGFLVSATGERFSVILPWLATTGNSFLSADLTSATADAPGGIAAMAHLYDLLHTHKVSFPPGSERQDFSLFTERKAAMVQGGTWDGYGLKERAPDMKFVMTNYPAWPGEGGRRATVTWVNMMMMPKGSRHPKETWEYLRYYGGLQVAKDMLTILLRNSPRKDLYDTQEWKDAVAQNHYLELIPEICASGATYPFKRYEEINEVFRPYFQKALLGAQPIEEAMNEGDARVERVLEGNWADQLLRSGVISGAPAALEPSEAEGSR